MKIGAAILAHNMAPLVGAAINSLSWVDGIYLFNDHSTDKMTSVAHRRAKTPLYIEKSPFPSLAFEYGELEVRNYIIGRAFEVLQCEILLSVDADELFSVATRKVIESTFQDESVESLAFTTWHLFDEKRYFHIWETTINGTPTIDPHARAFRPGKHFERTYIDGSHPRLRITENTRAVHGPHHFHLKYFRNSPFPNYTFNFMPKWITEESACSFLQNLPFTLPIDIELILARIPWDRMQKTDIPHHTEGRVLLEDPHEARIHPRDKYK
jgi:hypothetical protein